MSDRGMNTAAVSADIVDIELELAENLAALYARDYDELVQWCHEIEYLPDLTDDDLEPYADGFVDAALELVVERDTSSPMRFPRPRSPFEMMIDRACGIEVRDGVVYPISGVPDPEPAAKRRNKEK